MKNVEADKPYETIYHDGSWNKDELRRLARGERIDRNGHRYAVCDGCRKVICLDKLFFGSMHVCE